MEKISDLASGSAGESDRPGSRTSTAPDLSSSLSCRHLKSASAVDPIESVQYRPLALYWGRHGNSAFLSHNVCAS